MYPCFFVCVAHIRLSFGLTEIVISYVLSLSFSSLIPCLLLVPLHPTRALACVSILSYGLSYPIGPGTMFMFLSNTTFELAI